MFSIPRTEIVYCNAPLSKFNPNLELYKDRYARAINNGNRTERRMQSYEIAGSSAKQRKVSLSTDRL